ncbi:unnamed protein product [Schistosoma turkestanicum]|nr:unnamed protein product [Schistosoma turkestanicum]
MLFVGNLVGYCLLMMCLTCAFGLECKSQSIYESRILHCACDAPNITWTLNSSRITKKLEDGGIYKCFDSTDETKECSSVCLKADDPELYYKAIHDQSIPDVKEDEQERPYWHQKMKAIPEVYEFSSKPLKLACYFYIKNNSVTPLVQWIMPSDHDNLIVHHSEQFIRLNCSSLTETQRNLTGSCYVTEITINSVSGTDSFDCIVRTPNHSDTITNSFTVLQKLNHIFFPYSSDTEFEAPNFELIDELRSPNEVGSGNVNNDDVPSDWFSVTNKKNLDLSTLILTNYTEFQFYLLNNVTCLSKEVNLICRIPRTLSQLEVWYLGQYDKQPRLLKNSKTSDSLIINEKRHVSFDNSITLKLENLSHSDSGLYICKNDFFYKNITIAVMDCSQSNFILRFLPPILIWIIIFITISIIPLSLIYCIRVRRKSMHTVLSIPIDFLDKHAKSKRRDVFSKMNLLYTTPTHKLLLHHSASSTSSSPSSSPLSPCTMYSRSTSSNISNFDNDTKLQITDILMSFSQRLFCQQSKYFSKNHNILYCNVMLLQWLYQYLNTNPKTYIPRSSFKLENLLGEGNYGIVYKGKLCINSDDESNSNNIEVAVKTLKDGFRNRQLVNLIREAKILSELEPHPNIITFYGICIDHNHPYILLELAVYGNLRDFLRNRRPPGINFWADERMVSSSYVTVANSTDLKELLTESSIQQLRIELIKYALDIADALLYFETLSLCHRDVAARNVVITEGFIAKLCDFGYTCTQEELNNGYMEMDKDYLAIRWMAPECLTTAKCYTSKCDVWSYGILLWELFSLGNSPYPGIDNGQLIEWLNSGNRNTRPYLSTNAIYFLMLECWSQDPDSRPTFHDICNRIAMMKSNYDNLKETNDLTKGYVELVLQQEDYLQPRQYLN